MLKRYPAALKILGAGVLGGVVVATGLLLLSLMVPVHQGSLQVGMGLAVVGFTLLGLVAAGRYVLAVGRSKFPDVRSRAWRVLAKGDHLVGYRPLAGSPVDDRVARQVALGPGEEVLGVYENPPDAEAPAILVTTHALRVVGRSGEQLIQYDRIRSVAGPSAKDVARPSIVVVLDDGSRVEIPVLGRKGSALDAFEVLRFVTRVVEDLRDARSG